MTEPTSQQTRRFQGFALGALIYTIAVIVYGAWVRITGSGAGCGQHWPTCHGEAIPRTPTAETIVEFTHRITSGLCLIAVLVLLVLALRWFPRAHPARGWSIASVTLMITEALLGASLVIFGLVEDNDSGMRALFMTLHLVNTLALTGAMTAATYWGGRIRPVRVALHPTTKLALIAGAVLLVVTSMTGAVTALGDTLYPVDTSSPDILGRLQLQGHDAAHFLIRLRIIHPILAIAAALYVAVLSAGLALRAEAATPKRWGNTAAALVLAQIVVGFVNIALSAPGWMQLIHLAMATLLWCAYVLLILTLRDSEHAAPAT